MNLRSNFALTIAGLAAIASTTVLLLFSKESNDAPALESQHRELARHWFKKTENPNGLKVWRRNKWSWYNDKKKEGRAYAYYADRPGWTPHPNKPKRLRAAASRGADGPPAVEAPGAYQTVDGAVCPESYEPLTSPEECESLATAAGSSYGAPRDNGTGRPRGCNTGLDADDNLFYEFNVGDGGNAGPGVGSVCQLELTGAAAAEREADRSAAVCLDVCGGGGGCAVRELAGNSCPAGADAFDLASCAATYPKAVVTWCEGE